MKRMMVSLGLIVLGLALGTAGAQTSSFTFIQFDVPFQGAVDTGGVGINNLGEIVGNYSVFDPFVNDFLDHGFLRDAQGNFTELKDPFSGPHFGTLAKQINNRGQIVGRFFNETGAHGYLLSMGIYSQIDVPFSGAFATKARGINDVGMIVGTYRDVNKPPLKFSHERGFLRDSAGGFSPIDFPGAAFTHASKINNLGQIVGAYLDSSLHAHGFLLSQDTPSTIDFPGASETIVTGINNNGEIVGVYTDSSGGIHNFLGTGGTLIEIVLPGIMGNTGGVPFIDFYINIGNPGVVGINDRGQITGSFEAPDTSIHGFLGTPTEQ